MDNFKWHLFFAIAWIIACLVYPWFLMYPIWIFGSIICRMFQVAPYFFPRVPDYILRIAGVFIGLISIALILFFQRRNILSNEKLKV